MRDLLCILAVARRQWRWMVFGVVAGCAVIVTNALLMALAGWFIAAMAVAGATGAEINYFLPAAAIRGLAILRTSGRYGERLVTHEAALRVLADLRVWLFERLEPLAPAGLERYGGGDVAGRLRADVDALESLYLRIVAPLITGVATIVFAFLYVARRDLLSGVALLAVLLLAGFCLPLLVRRLASGPGRRAAQRSGELRAAVTEGLLGSEELILLGAEERQAAEIDRLSAELEREKERFGTIGGLTLAGGIVCGGLGITALLVTGGLAVTAGRMEGPVLVMLLLFAAATFEAAGLLPGALQHLPGAREAVRRIRELSEMPPALPEPATPVEPAGTKISFRNVTCRYGDGVTALDSFNLSIGAGERVALTGASGIGKSTVAELLMRFREYSGSITVGGAEVREIASAALPALIAAVPQAPHLFNATIRENILLGRPDADGEALAAAVADAGLSGWIGRLPRGLDTPVGEMGRAVSGGEGRRIALARALLLDAPILVLDEPTEGLDAATEREVVARLSARTKGRTLLVVTHRPACLALADRVVRLG